MKGYFYRRINGCTFRYRKNTEGYDIDIKLNDACARIVGYSNLGEFLANDNALGFEKLIDSFGKVPKYITIRINGKNSDTAEGKQFMRFYEKK